MKIVFFGVDEFADVVLAELKKADFDIVAEIRKPISSKDLDLPEADLGIVVVYGKFLSGKILNHFKHGILNIHPSMLPKYRGPSPIRSAIANGDTTTGVSIIKLNNEMDAGDILVQQELEINPNEMHSSLRDRLARKGAELLIQTIPGYADGKAQLTPQDHSQATFTEMLTREDGKVDLINDSPTEIYNKYRAYEDWPGIYIIHKSKNQMTNLRVKILKCHIDGNGNLVIDIVQPEGKKPMDLKSFENGYEKVDRI